jgi:4-hydroxybutyryl-CoA dehydratase/vinylacetyl-CoA-Delta-isomerase
MKTPEEYIASLRERDIRLVIRGELVANPVDHPMVAPSLRTVAETYRLAAEPEHRDTFVAHSRFIDGPVSRFTHVFEHPEDLRKKQQMQRILGRCPGTCFQRCVGMDAINALYTTTHGGASHYHERFLAFLQRVQRDDLMLCGAMTDAKGDRRKGPSAQPDMYLRVVDRDDSKIVVRGAKLHQTGAVNAHEIVVMPGRAMTSDEGDFAVAAAIEADAKGITYVYGRQPSDQRRLGCDADQGNARYGGQEAIILFDDVEIPMERVFMLGETDRVAELVDTFAHYHRHSYGGCKPGNGDVLIGAATLVARMNGVEKASHIRDKLVEMVHLNETMYSCGVAAGACCSRTSAGTVMVDPLLANVCKQNVTRAPYEMARLAEDIAGGLVVTMPSAEDFDHEEVGPLLRRYLAGATATATDKARVIRLIENMTLGAGAVAFRTESMHGAGSPQAQRVRIAAQADFDGKVAAAERIAGISADGPE